MFKNRSFNVLVGLTIAVLAVLSIGTVAFNQRNTSAANSSPLDWYFSHDHAIIDGDNAVVSGANIPVNESPLDWYFSHDHAIIDGDNNTVPTSAINASAEQDMRMVMQELERERLDRSNANLSTVLVRATNGSAEQDMRMVMQELERERLDQLNTNTSSTVPTRATNASAEQDMRMVMQELERERFEQPYKSFDASSISCLDSRVSCDR